MRFKQSSMLALWQNVPLLLSALLLARPVAAGSAADTLQPAPGDQEGWSFNIAPYLWAIALDGSLTVGRASGDVSVSDKELLEHLKAALMLEASVRKNRVGIFGDLLAAKLKGDGVAGPGGQVTADVRLRMLKTNFGMDYLLGPYPLGAKTNAVRVTLDPYAGGRYFYLDTEIFGSGPATDLEGSESWLDPLIGVRTVWDLSRHWNVLLGGNVGGFGVGSDLSAEGLATVGYRFHISRRVVGNVMAGYRAFYQDYSHQSFTFDATLHGPIFGFAVTF